MPGSLWKARGDAVGVLQVPIFCEPGLGARLGAGEGIHMVLEMAEQNNVITFWQKTHRARGRLGATLEIYLWIMLQERSS